MDKILLAVLKRSSVYLILIGVVLLLLGATGGVIVGTFSLKIASLIAQWIIFFLGLILIGMGVISEANGGLFSGNSKPKQNSVANVYKTRNESYAIYLNAINQATESIDIISHYNLTFMDAKRAEFYDSIYKAILNRHLTHQQLIWNLDHLHWLDQKLKIGWDNLDEYSVRYFHVDPTKSPMTTFNLIDQTIVFMGKDWLIEGHLELKGTDVGAFFRGYFASLWNKGESLKERGKPANKKRIKELIQELTPNE